MRPSPRQIDRAALRRVLRQHAEVIAAYVYGSYARGCPRRESDLDLAVLLREKRGRLVSRLQSTYEVDLGGEVGSAIGHPRVEVVILNLAAPLLAWEIVRHGQRLFARRRHAVLEYELRLRQRYLDTQRLRAIQDQYLSAIIRAGFSKAVMS